MEREHDFGLKLNILSHKLKKRLNAELAKLGITGVQSRILHYILVHCEREPVFQRDIENVFGMSRSTATGILQLLERDGMIYRESVSSDARLKSIVPTKKAVTIDAQVLELIVGIEHKLVSGISEEEQSLFFSITDRMAQNLDN